MINLIISIRGGIIAATALAIVILLGGSLLFKTMGEYVPSELQSTKYSFKNYSRLLTMMGTTLFMALVAVLVFALYKRMLASYWHA